MRPIERLQAGRSHSNDAAAACSYAVRLIARCLRGCTSYHLLRDGSHCRGRPPAGRARANMQRHETAADDRAYAGDRSLPGRSASPPSAPPLHRAHARIPSGTTASSSMLLRRSIYGGSGTAQLLHHFQRPARAAELQQIDRRRALMILRSTPSATHTRPGRGAWLALIIAIAHHTLDQNLHPCRRSLCARK